ncbi:stage III sporulation protein AF [Clostridium massiliodielmoense]|uniref:stage III sporulation protein AF n=1 Tax=Clostridium massiliodielmoense TaxID=1776385 RepID=UPI0004D5AA0E|nr:stage III sporulation protein AF [Clostridium massiliodielmoense]KEH95916.1 stage III sporulation protein AF [Clostridium botulinum C/D str. BKT12695]
MIVSIKQWVVNICTAIFFITAVEMILPNNSMKKYAKFVLGLILITVILNPIIKLFNRSFNFEGYINSASQYIDQKQYKNNYGKYKTESIGNTSEVFANNLEKLCNKKLKDKYPKDNYNVKVKVLYNDEKEKFDIQEINIGVKEEEVKKIRKITIDKTKEVATKKVIEKGKSSKIINYLSESIDIPKEKIKVYKA